MGARGPAPTPTKILQMSGSRLVRERTGEPDPRVSVPPCPSWLDKRAREEWKRKSEWLEELGIISDGDDATLAIYCQGISDIERLTNELRKEGETYTTPNGYVAKNPKVTILRETIERVMKAAAQFGMTPSSRSRISVNARTVEETPEQIRKRRILGG